MFDRGDAGGAADSTTDRGAAGVGSAGGWEACASGLSVAVDGLLAVDPDALADGELAEAMVALRREQARLAAGVAELTAAFEARQVHSADGARSATDWIATRCRIPRAQARREVRDARRLRTMPATRVAFRAGDIGAAHVSALCRLAGHPRAGQHFGDGEEVLVDHARTLRFDDWKRVCDHWLAAADPGGPELKRERDQDLRSFGIPVGLDGVGHPDGYLTPLATETVNEALARIERELFTQDWAEAEAVHGEATTVAHLARTPAQRRHDALVELAVRASTAPADAQRPAPLVTVMIDYPTLAGRVCELAGSGTVVPPGDITQLLAKDATLIERVVFDGPNRVIDISSARTFRGTLRHILDLIHRRCNDDTCFVPASRCEGDHIQPWSEGGPTSQDNGGLGCGFHNRLWFRRPDLRPPAHQLTLDVPDGDPATGADAPPPARGEPPPGDLLGGLPAGEPPDPPAAGLPPRRRPDGSAAGEPPSGDPPAHDSRGNSPTSGRGESRGDVGRHNPTCCRRGHHGFTHAPDLVWSDGTTSCTIAFRWLPTVTGIDREPVTVGP